MKLISLAGMLLPFALIGCGPMPYNPYAAQMADENARRAQADQARNQQGIVNPARPAYQSSPPPRVSYSAFWTGKSQPAMSVTSVAGMNCEYNLNGRLFWRMHSPSCPSMIEVQ